MLHRDAVAADRAYLKGDLMLLRLTALAAALLMLAACSSTPEPAPAARAGPAVRSGWAPGGTARRGSARGRSRIWRRPPATACSSPSTAPRSRPRRSRSWQRQAEWLRRYPNVSGHDRGPLPTSAAPANTIWRSASAARRRSRTCWSRWASRPSRISTISYGKERPAVPGSTEEAYAQNRRAVTVVN